MEKINLMALRHSAFYSPYLMTLAGGYLAQAGFDATYTVQSPDNLVTDRLLDGGCQVSQSAVAAGFASLESHRPNNIRHFAQINSRDGFFIAAREPDNNFNWKKLTGSQVLVDHFFQPMAMLKYALYKQGIEWSDVNVVDAGNVTQIDAAFRNGAGDYVHQQGPAPQQLQADGIATVVASVGEAIGPVAFSSLCATDDWLKTDMARTFFEVYKQALEHCKDDESDDISMQLQSYGFFKEIDFQVLSNTIKTYQTLGSWNHNGSIGYEAYEVLLDVFEHSRLISHRYPYETLVFKSGQ